MPNQFEEIGEALWMAVEEGFRFIKSSNVSSVNFVDQNDLERLLVWYRKKVTNEN